MIAYFFDNYLAMQEARDKRRVKLACPFAYLLPLMWRLATTRICEAKARCKIKGTNNSRTVKLTCPFAYLLPLMWRLATTRICEADRHCNT